MLILACAVTTYHRSFPCRKKVGHSAILAVNILSIFALAFCAVVGYIRLDSEIHLRQALEARNRGDWQKMQSEIDRADSYFYQLDPVSVPLAWYRGIASYSLGEFQQAHQDFNKAYHVHPNHIHVLNNLGTSYAKLGDYENAVFFYRKAIDVWPGFAEAQTNLGIILYHMGDLAMARNYLLPLRSKDSDIRIAAYLKLIDSQMN
jgi:tetratricopeptide (TPR) repeat protein